MCTFDNAPFVAKVDMEIRSTRIRDKLFNERLRVVELERLSGISNLDNPVIEFQ